ncbi:MAG: translocation/assembly module TamB domain-containing protein [Candidatus Eremiobacteraeota bacterium]|nr:translocation/assembly module TamB domain-containing protein [Candidatus Eremiobacteraeota bacterium]
MRKRWVTVLAIAAAIIGFVIVNRHEVLRYSIQALGGLASGYTITLADQRLAIDEMSLFDVHVSHKGYPLLDAERIDVHYSLRDLLPGSTHRFGLTGVDIDKAKLTIVKFSDGTYNFIIPSGGPSGPPFPQPAVTVPIRFDLDMDGAALELREPNAYDPSAKDVLVNDFNVDASIDTAKQTHYRARGIFRERTQEPFTIVGTIDAERSFALHHAHAPRFPLRALANYFADTPAVRILRGGARNFDARLFSLDVKPNQPANYHVNLTLDVDGGRMALSSLAEPIENIRGHLQLVDNAFFLKRVDGTLAGIPLRVTGGIYDLTGGLTGAAQLRLGVYGTGDLRDLRNAFTFTRSQPVAGRITLGVLVEGPIDNPLILARGRALRTTWQRLPFDALEAGILYHDNVLAYAPLHAYYGGTEVGIRGTMLLGKKLHSELAVHIVGSADRLPYLDEMLGPEPMIVDADAVGNDLLFHVRGAMASARGAQRVAAILDLEPNGTGSVDPFWFHTERGDFDGGYFLDRPHDASGFWMLASNLRMRAPSYKAFPGIDLPQMPKVNGDRVSMSMAGGGAGKNVALAGISTADATDIAGVKFDRVTAGFSGTLANATVNLLRASGPWGEFNGQGAFSSEVFVARGSYRGTFEGLQPFLGSAIPGHGALAGTASIAVENNRIVVQGSNLRMHGATLHGIPIDRADITLAVAGNDLRVYAAHATAAGGDVVAAGAFNVSTPPNPSRALSLVVRGLDSSQLQGIGLPFEAGRLWASGNLSGGSPIPTFDGGVAIAGGKMQQYAVSGAGDVRVAGDAAHLSRMMASLGPSYAYVRGSIGTLSSGTPSYAIDATVPAGPIAGSLRALNFPTYETDGSFNARLHLGGRGLYPSVSGDIGVPAGEVNGLPFVNGSAQLAADPSGFSVRGGSVDVGSTHARFSAATHPQHAEMHVVATRAALSDFNNFFDTGDTLAGTGSVRMAVATQGERLQTSGDIDVLGFRYRNLPIGDTRASWSSANDRIDGSLAVGGNEGMLRAHGSIAIAPSADLASTLQRTRYDVTGSMSNLDLSLWVPALGLQRVPITGRASGDATIHGRWPRLNAQGAARVDSGTLGPLTLDRADVAFHSNGARIAIDRAELLTPGLEATASGSFALRPSDAIDVTVHASTDQPTTLIYQLARVRVPLSGAFESTLQVGGTLHAPAFRAGIDATNVQAYGIGITSLFGSVHLNGNKLVLSNAGATFAKGEATLAGSLPLELSPLRIGPPSQPVSFDLDVIDLDPSFLDAILGNNTKLGGNIAGHVGISGTVRQPVVLGQASLTNGSYVSDLERIPITQTVASLSFNRTGASIGPVSAKLGSGTLAGSGNVEFPQNRGLAFVVKAIAKEAQLDLPAYGAGTIDADVALTKTPSSQALLSGNAVLSNATMPFVAFINAAQNAAGSGVPPLPMAFDFTATAGKNVRVRGSGYGAGLDIGATGSVRLAGTLKSPTLDGSFTSSGGTLTYFDRAFRVQEGAVQFNPSDGLIPTIHAVGSTNVVNPDPDRARNPYGTAQIAITVDGQLENLKIGFTTVPSGYSREQVIAMLAPFGGFVSGIGFNSAAALAPQSPGGITPYGAVAPIPGIYDLQRNGTITVGQEAFNILNAQFTAGLLGPVETAIGQGLGLSSVNLTLGYYGNVGVTATRVLGKAVNAVYATTFGLPSVQSFGIQIQPNENTSATLSFFYQTGPVKVLETTPASSVAVGNNQEVLLGQPIYGTSGFSFKLQRYL